MHMVVIGWLFVILMMSITYYPDIPAMLLRFLGLGVLPVWLWLKLVGFVHSKPTDPSTPGSPSGRKSPGAGKNKNAGHP